MASSSREQALEAGARMGGAPWFSLIWPGPCQSQVHVQQLSSTTGFTALPCLRRNGEVRSDNLTMHKPGSLIVSIVVESKSNRETRNLEKNGKKREPAGNGFKKFSVGF